MTSLMTRHRRRHKIILKLLTLGIAAVLYSVMAIAVAGADTEKPRPNVLLPESIHEFDPVIEGALVEHKFTVLNRGDADLEIIEIKSG